LLSQRLRHRVSIEVLVPTRNQTSGSVKESWQSFWCDSQTEIKDWPAEVLTGPGRESVASGAKQSETDARITLRWFPGLTQSMRLIFEGETYDIQSIEKDKTGRREYRLRCNFGAGEGS